MPDIPSKPPPPCSRSNHRAFTLVEVLIVISIIVIVMAVCSQMLTFSIEARRTREAARAVNLYFCLARNRAKATGRPCGVLLQKTRGQPWCTTLSQAEVPPLYAGCTLEASARLQITDPSGRVLAKMDDDSMGIDTRLVKAGDSMQLNYQGPMYKIIEPVQSDLLTLQVDLSQGQMLPWPTGSWSTPVPYQIIRQPLKAAVKTLQLPMRAIIDLRFSGSDGEINGRSQPLSCIMFSPDGSLDQVYRGDYIHAGVEPIFLLVGKQDSELPNWKETHNFWVVLNPQGTVTTAEVAQGTNIDESREIARENQSMGGR